MFCSVVYGRYIWLGLDDCSANCGAVERIGEQSLIKKLCEMLFVSEALLEVIWKPRQLIAVSCTCLAALKSAFVFDCFCYGAVCRGLLTEILKKKNG